MYQKTLKNSIGSQTKIAIFGLIMRKHYGLGSSLPDLAGAIVTIGNFDGVHLGHQALIRAVVEKARSLGTKSVVVSFDPHPAQVLRRDQNTELLYTREESFELIGKYGVDELIVLKFDEQLSKVNGDVFARDMIAKIIKPNLVILGHDFSFGHKRSGNLETMLAVGREFNFECIEMPAVTVGDEVVSSSKIRERLKRGDIESANEFLGRPYTITGPVIRGDGRGKKIGFPTANINPNSPVILQSGVYGSRVEIDGTVYNAMTNIGVRPTFTGSPGLHVETHILDFSDDIYGRELKVQFAFRIRDELKFSSVHELIDRIKQDIAAARKRF